MKPLRLMVYDATCRGAPAGLSDAWRVGGALYRALGRLDRIRGAASWAEALAWLAEVEPSRAIASIELWGHGKWGTALMAGEPLDVRALEAGHPHHQALAAIRARLVGPEALWWFRCCECFGAEAGHELARRWSRFFSCRAAGHTYVIGFWQSGLHSLEPGAEPGWSPDEGLAAGTPAAPRAAKGSWPWEPYTISCLGGEVPAGW